MLKGMDDWMVRGGNIGRLLIDGNVIRDATTSALRAFEQHSRHLINQTVHGCQAKIHGGPEIRLLQAELPCPLLILFYSAMNCSSFASKSAVEAKSRLTTHWHLAGRA
jgi:hypothetical protein